MSYMARWSVGAAGFAALVAACLTGTEPLVVLVDLGADSASVVVGDSIHLDLVAVRANGDTVPNQQILLSSSDSGVAVMAADGWVHGIAQGIAAIRASSGVANDSTIVTVLP